MHILTSKQCMKCLTWKVPHFIDITTFGEAPKWAVIFYCPSDICSDDDTPTNDQEGLIQ